MITQIVATLGEIFEEFDYTWLTQAMNTNLPMELDFAHEVRNLNKTKQQCRRMIDRGDLCIPEVQVSSDQIRDMS